MKGFDLKSYAAEPQFVKEIGHSVKKVRHDRCQRSTVTQAAGQEGHHELMILSAQCWLSTAKPVLRDACITGLQTMPVGAQKGYALTHLYLQPFQQ